MGADAKAGLLNLGLRGYSAGARARPSYRLLCRGEVNIVSTLLVDCVSNAQYEKASSGFGWRHYLLPAAVQNRCTARARLAHHVRVSRANFVKKEQFPNPQPLTSRRPSARRTVAIAVMEDHSLRRDPIRAPFALARARWIEPKRDLDSAAKI